MREVSIKSLRDIAFAYDKGAVFESIKKQIMSMQNDNDYEVKVIVSETLARF